MGKFSTKKIYKKRGIKKNPYRKFASKIKTKQFKEFISDAWYIQVYKDAYIIDSLYIIQFDHYNDRGNPMFNNYDTKKTLGEHDIKNNKWFYVGPFYSYNEAYDYANHEFPGLKYIEQHSTKPAKIRILGYY